jgi:glycosyltransferase 2 family protein
VKGARSGLARLAPLAKGIAVVLAVGVLVWTLAGADLARVGALVGRAGGWIAVGLLPYVAAVLVDAAAWRVLLGGIVRPPLGALVRVRVRCDAFGATLPGGALIGESTAPSWLRRWMPLDAGIAAVAGRKCFVGLAEALYLLASCAVGFSVLGARAAALPWVVLGLGVGMLVLFGGTSLALASGSIAARIHAALTALPIPVLRAWIASRARGFRSTDERLGALFRSDPRRLAAGCALFVVAWSLEAVETWVLLRLVGVRLPLGTVFAFEASVSLLRSIGCFAPGGLGLQDLGYVAALGALGVPDAVTSGAAFVVLKRAKELTWALVGYATLLLPDTRVERRVSRSAALATLVALVVLVAVPDVSHAARSATASAPLFSISKTENRNYVQFAERLDASCAPSGSAPIYAYWRMLERGPSVVEAVLPHEEPAYGVASQTVLERGEGRGLVRVVLRALPATPLLVESRRDARGACEASARTSIAGVDARLFNVHAVLRWPFGIAHLLVSGWSLADGHPVRDTRAP